MYYFNTIYTNIDGNRCSIPTGTTIWKTLPLYKEKPLDKGFFNVFNFF